MSDDFDRLADSGRRELEAAAEREQVRARRGKVVRSFQDRWRMQRALYRGRGLVLDFALMVLAGVLVASFGPTLWTVAAIVVGGPIVRTLARWSWRTREVRRLHGLPFDFLVDGYLAQLAPKRGETQATVQVWFVEPPPFPSHAAIRQVFSGARVELDACDWDPDHRELLSVVSPSLDPDRNDDDGYSSNQSSLLLVLAGSDNGVIHAWIHRCLHRALRVVHDRYPIRQVAVSLRPS